MCLQIGVLLGGEENTTRKQMQEIIDFETRLAEITTPPEDRRDEEKLYNLMTLSDLQRKAPFVRFLMSLYRTVGRFPRDIVSPANFLAANTNGARRKLERTRKRFRVLRAFFGAIDRTIGYAATPLCYFQMSWVDYFQNATRLVNKKINSKAQIINFAPEYFTKLTKLVQEYNRTTTGKMYVHSARI